MKRNPLLIIYNTLRSKIAQLDPDDFPLSDEEVQQLNADEGFISGEEANREFKLKVDLP